MLVNKYKVCLGDYAKVTVEQKWKKIEWEGINY